MSDPKTTPLDEAATPDRETAVDEPRPEARTVEEQPRAAADKAPAQTEPQPAPEEELAALQAQLEQLNDRYLRGQAELENFRKRMQREMGDVRRYAVLPLIRDLLSVVDDLHRAIDAAQRSEAGSGLLEGVKMIADQLLAVLARHHCTRIDAVGTRFDPNLHEAIGQERSDQWPANTVTRELRVGYQLHDRVIRPSQVFVSSGPPPKEEPARHGAPHLEDQATEEPSVQDGPGPA